jgi:hypothetical protein
MLYSSLGSAIYIRPKQIAPQHNFVSLPILGILHKDLSKLEQNYSI